MKEQINPQENVTEILIDTINQGKEAIKQGFIFTQEQIPDIIHQLLYWKFTESLIYFILSIIITIITIILEIKAWKVIKNLAKEDEDWWAGWLFVHVLYVPLITLLYNLYNLTWLKILTAPKIYLIEYTVSLIK